MSRTAGVLRAISAAAAVAGIGMLLWWFATGQGQRTDAAEPAGTGETAAQQSVAATLTPDATPTPVPTATPVPTPTPIPTPMPFAEAAPLGTLADTLTVPLPECGLKESPATVDTPDARAGTVTLTCIEDLLTTPVVAAAEGRIVHVSTAPARTPLAPPNADQPPAWVWGYQAELGPHVVIDHGPLAGSANAQTVYAGLAAIEEGVRVGATVSAGDPLGSVAGPWPSLRFSLWMNDERQDGVRVVTPGPSADEQRAVAAALRPVIASPTDERCPLVLAYGQLPGAPREYRNGTHRGIDFGCGAADRSGYAIADGTVVYMVNDYNDPSVPEREALLQQAGIAGFTPHWTLVMLYGNVVVVDHGEIAGAGRVVTITAHLENVDPEIKLGEPVVKGQRLGELGNRGTNASAQGVRGAADPSLHLHWELFIDNWYLGAGLDAVTTSELIATALCGPAQTAGCPA